jgi:hypothetical protein
MTIRVKTHPRRTAGVLVLALAVAVAELVGCSGSGGQAAPVPTGIAGLPAVQAAKSRIVRITAVGCNVEQQFAVSGWVAPGGRVVSTADYFAGARQIEVSAAGSRSQLAASVVAFNTRTDVAVLRVAGLAAKPLALAGDANPKPNTPAALLGYPGNVFEMSDAMIAGTSRFMVPDAYGKPVERQIVVFDTDGPAGFAGGPLLNRGGNVIAMDAGTLPGGWRAAVPGSAIRQALNTEGPASTGACPNS